MKKLLLLLLLLCLVCVPALADTAHVVDGENLLTDEEEARLEDQILAFRDAHNFDFVVWTTDTTNGKEPRVAAADFYMDNGYGVGSEQDGLIVALFMTSRDFAYVSTGAAQAVFTASVLDGLYDDIVDYFSDGNYYDGFARYIELSNRRAEYPSGGMSWGDAISETAPLTIIFLVVGFVIAFIVVTVMKSGMKTARRKGGAQEYVKDGSFRLDASQDIFLYSTTTRVKIEKEKSSSGGGGSGSFSSSSGSSHTGGSGKF